MQVENPESSSSGSGNALQKDLFLFIHGGKRVVATRPQTYSSALEACRRLFPHIPRKAEIALQSKDLDVCEGELADISPESFELVVPLVTSFVVSATFPIPTGPPSIVPQIQPATYNPTIGGQTLPPGRPPVRLPVGMIPRPMTPPRRVHPPEGDCSSDNEGTEGQAMVSPWPRHGRKPIIYLFCPRDIEATVRLSLIPQWTLSAIYPVVPSKPRSASSNEEVEWRVRVRPNGDLTEVTTGLDVAYLFWEAHTNLQVPISAPPSPVLGQVSLDNCENFNPVTAVLTDENSVVLPVTSITLYLDGALRALGLHTEARTSFITYWLPSFLKHKCVALRFLPQTAYEKAAPLRITPKPDNITRIFMLFQGIEEEELIDWKRAQARRLEDVSFWADIAGVDLEKALDPAIFRVLEWGGMEVLRSKLSVVED